MSRSVRCERCERENDAGLAFCLDCGLPLRAAPAAPPQPPAAACTSCGTPLQPGFRFCGNCGAPAAASPRRPIASPRTPAPDGDPGPTGTGAQAACAPPPLPGAPAASVRLVTVRADGLPGTQFALHAEETVCGRLEGPVRLPDDPTVSPAHARFTLRGGVLAVEDLGSANGTFVRLRGPRRLLPGDEVRVGRQLLRLELLPRPPAGDASRPWGGPDDGARLRLVQLLDGGGAGEAFPLRPGESTIGREVGDVTFPADRYVSGRHARLEADAEGVTVVDAGSSNGTFVRLAGPTVLEPGDQLLVGAQLLRVEA